MASSVSFVLADEEGRVILNMALGLVMFRRKFHWKVMERCYSKATDRD